MITKAIVEEVLSPYQVKVRIPLLDRAQESPMSTEASSLNTATICCFPQCYLNPQVGDVVFVGFEDNTYYKAVILGHLSHEAMNDSYTDVLFSKLNVKDSATIPYNTTIGDVSPIEISRLSGIQENIQKQIDELRDEINMLVDRLNQ